MSLATYLAQKVLDDREPPVAQYPGGGGPRLGLARLRSVLLRFGQGTLVEAVGCFVSCASVKVTTV